MRSAWVSYTAEHGLVTQSLPGTRIIRGRRGTAISGIWPSRYRENDRDNRDKWNPKNVFKNCFLPFLAGFPCLKQASNLLRATLSLHKHL